MDLSFHFFLPVLNESLFSPRHISSPLTKERAEKLTEEPGGILTVCSTVKDSVRCCNEDLELFSG